MNFEILKEWHHTWQNGYHLKLTKFRQFQKIKIQGNHAYEKLDSNEKEHSKIKDLEFHSRSKNVTYKPKLSGNALNKDLLRPKTVKFRRCTKPSGILDIGFEEKSTICRDRHSFMFSGISAISVKNNGISFIT